MSECTGFRISWNKGLASGCDAGISRETYRPTLVGLAMALDECQDCRLQGRGSYGSIGFGGCHVEACFDGDPEDEDTEAEEINDLSQAEKICGKLKFGDRSEARLFRVYQNQETVWNGNNHIGCSTYHVDELLKEY